MSISSLSIKSFVTYIVWLWRIFSLDYDCYSPVYSLLLNDCLKNARVLLCYSHHIWKDHNFYCRSFVWDYRYDCHWSIPRRSSSNEYRELVKLRRVVCILAIEWIASAVWSGSWFLSAHINMYSGAVGLFSCCLIIPLCDFSIYQSHVAQIHLNLNSSVSTDFDVAQYKETVNSILWIYGLLFVCYMPHFTSFIVILFTGLNTTSRFALHLSSIAVFVNSSLNPILYCWKIKEIKEIVIVDIKVLRNFVR